MSSPAVAWEIPRIIRDLDKMSTAEGSGGSDGSGGVLKLPQLKRSRGVHRRAPPDWQQLATQQADGPLEVAQATWGFINLCRKILTELDAQKTTTT